ncbi:MAG: sugar ABC transporter substrate-binding protein, partial [Leifsonia sp.]
MRKIALATVAVAAAAALALSGCSSRDGSSGSSTASGFAKDASIGVALPTKTSENWVLAGGLFENGLKEAGFKGDVQYAGGSGVSDQQSQIQSMITNGA